MREQLKALYDLQQVDSRLLAARRELAAIENGTALKAQIEAARNQAEKLRKELQRSEAELQDAELQLKSIEQKKATFEKRLYGGEVSNPKELSGIEKEIEVLSRSRAAADEKILELYDEVDRRRAELKELDSRIAAASERLARVTQKFESESRRLTDEIAALEAERAAALPSIEPALLRRYDAIRQRAAGLGIAKVEEGKCGGCHVSLTPFMARKVKEDPGPTFCENCGRFLLGDE